MMDIHNMMKILQRAQDTYGYPNQISVAMEELAELIAALAKYPRFPDHTTAMADKKFRDHVIEEVADVHVVIQHIYMMFGLNPEEVEQVMDKKLERLSRWMDTSEDFSHTMEDRELERVPEVKECRTCAYGAVFGRYECKYCFKDGVHVGWKVKK